MKCLRVRDEIKAYVDGELGALARWRIARHLARCAECREEEIAMVDLTNKMRMNPQMAAPEGLRERVLQSVRPEPGPAVVRKLWNRPALSMVVSVIIVCAVGAAVIPTFTRTRGSSTELSARENAKAIGVEMRLASPSPPSAKSLGAPAPGGMAPSQAPAPMFMVIKTADLKLEVERFQEAYGEAVSIAGSLGGYVTDSSAETSGPAPSTGRMTIRVPVREFERGVERLSTLGKVREKSVSGEDVTGEVVDLESRLRNKRAEERQYLQIMNRAQRIPDIVTVSSELYRVRGEIEEMEGRLKYLKSAAAMSTINLTIIQKQKPKPAASALGKTWSSALTSLAGTFRSLAAAGIWLLVYSPFWALPIGALLYAKRRSLTAQHSCSD